MADLCTRGSASKYEPVVTLDTAVWDGASLFRAPDATTGAVRWKRQLPQPDFGCATAADGVVFTATADGHLYGFDAASGATLWQAHAPAGINGCPALSGGMLLVPAGSVTSRISRPKFEVIAYALTPVAPRRCGSSGSPSGSRRRTCRPRGATR